MEVTVKATPFAEVWGTIEVPDDLEEGEINEYVEEHFDDISFGEPELDYCGTDLEIEM